MLRLRRFSLLPTLIVGSVALVSARAAEGDPSPEPVVVLTDSADLGASLLVAPAVESEQVDAAEALNREFGPAVVHDEFPSGRWNVSPHLEAGVTYDDNIFIQPDHEVEDFIFTLAPGIAIGIWDSEKRRTDGFLDRHDAATTLAKRGSYFTIDYTAILLGFAKTDSQNAFDQDARLDARLQGARWTLAGGVRYESKSEANADIGTRIHRETFSAEFNATYRVSEKTAIDSTVLFRANDPEDYVRSTRWEVESYASYALTPIVRAGIGAAFGGVDIDGGSGDIYERILARAAYVYSAKLDFEVRGGVEFRQSDGRSGDRVNPIFSVLAGYEPSIGTRIDVEAFRSVETSEIRPDVSYERTGITAGFRRSIRAGVFVRLDGGYQQSDYSGLAEGEGRRDRYFFVRPGILYNFAEWGNATLAYEVRRNDSNRGVSSFDNNQINFQVNISY